MPTISSLPKIKRRPIHTLWCLAACLLLVGGPPECGATVSGPEVLGAMLKQLGSAKTLTVRQRVESVRPGDSAGLGPPAGPELVAVPETGGAGDTASAAFESGAEVPEALPPVLMEDLTYQLPGGFRAEIRAEAIHRLYLEVGGEALLTIDGHLEPLGGSWFEAYKDLLLFTRRLALHRHLALEGVDLGVSSLGLWEGRPVHVLGARFPDAAPAQIWVDKETLLPLRWLWSQAHEVATSLPEGGITAVDGLTGAGLPAEGRRFEIRYDRWQLFGKRRYPLRVQFFENHELVRTLIAEAVVVDQKVETELMDLEAARRLALPPEGDLPHDQGAGDPEVDEIQEAIDIFKKRYE